MTGQAIGVQRNIGAAVRHLGFAFVIAALIAADQATKLLVVATIPLGAAVPIFGDVFRLVHTRNTGAAFGILGNLGPEWSTPIFLVVFAIAIVLLIRVYLTHAGRIVDWMGLAFMLGGAAGNIIDRLRIGAVIDFLDFSIGSYHWPAFNLADSCITVGLGLYLLVQVRQGFRRGDGNGGHDVHTSSGT